MTQDKIVSSDDLVRLVEDFEQSQVDHIHEDKITAIRYRTYRIDLHLLLRALVGIEGEYSSCYIGGMSDLMINTRQDKE